jgi:hypothetical protein
MRDAAASSSYPYPWTALDADLRSTGRQSFPCLAYGSLINAASAARTLSTPAAGLALAFGVRRLFNYEMIPGSSAYGPPSTPAARTALNVIATGVETDVVNGALFEIQLRDIEAFRQRETAYDLIRVACLDWEQRDGPPFIAFILHCPAAPADPTALEPHHAYYQACRDGAASRGADFLRTWLATTYLADGRTPVLEWEPRLASVAARR